MTSICDTWIDNIIKEWTNNSIKFQDGASLELILNTEQIIDFIFPEQVREFYLRVNGFSDWEYNENLFSIWSLERILKEYSENDDKMFVGFSDFLINSYWIGFIKGQDGIFKSYNEEKIAASFKEAVEMINNNSDLIY